jgi:hypothetical protein
MLFANKASLLDSYKSFTSEHASTLRAAVDRKASTDSLYIVNGFFVLTGPSSCSKLCSRLESNKVV